MLHYVSDPVTICFNEMANKCWLCPNNIYSWCGKQISTLYSQYISALFPYNIILLCDQEMLTIFLHVLMMWPTDVNYILSIWSYDVANQVNHFLTIFSHLVVNKCSLFLQNRFQNYVLMIWQINVYYFFTMCLGLFPYIMFSWGH